MEIITKGKDELIAWFHPDFLVNFSSVLCYNSDFRLKPASILSKYKCSSAEFLHILYNKLVYRWRLWIFILYFVIYLAHTSPPVSLYIFGIFTSSIKNEVNLYCTQKAANKLNNKSWKLVRYGIMINKKTCRLAYKQANKQEGIKTRHEKI